MKCTECKFNIDGRCEIKLPPFAHTHEADRMIRDGDGCDLGVPIGEVTI